MAESDASPTGDPHIEQSEQADAERAAKAARLFDIRRLIGGLFLIYGVILTVLGLGESDASIAKSADINVNLYAGIGMLIMGAASSPGRCGGRSATDERGVRAGGRRARGRRRRRRRGAGSRGVAGPARRRRSRRPSSARRPRRRA